MNSLVPDMNDVVKSPTLEQEGGQRGHPGRVRGTGNTRGRTGTRTVHNRVQDLGEGVRDDRDQEYFRG